MPEPVPVVSACSYNLFHCPYFAMEYGTTPASERAARPGSAFLAALPQALRSFAQAAAYVPNQVFIGNLDPRRMPERPWHGGKPGGTPPRPPKDLPAGAYPRRHPGDYGSPVAGVETTGPFGRILTEKALYALLRIADAFDLVVLEKGFREEAARILQEDGILSEADRPRLKDGVEAAALKADIREGALPLVTAGITVGCVKSAHPTDQNLSAHTMLENLASKATAVYALRRLLADNRIDPAGIDYVLETSEEACGDMNQRGGGNFAKAIGELAGLSNATGADIRSFCAGPVHGLLQAAALVRSCVFERVIVVAGGTTAKLAMNAKKHLEKNLPVLEDCLGSFAFLVERDAPRGLALRCDAVGRHRIGSGSSPQAVMQDLVAEPLSRAGLSFSDVDRYAPELQNPEITEAAGAGNVTLANLKMIAATAVMKKEISREEMDSFIETHGVPGWAPTQGHIPSGVPALGWFLRWAAEGTLKRGLVIGKGSLFLGRMTNLFDGISLLVEARGSPGAALPAARISAAAPRPATSSASTAFMVGLTLPGSDGGEQELRAGAEAAQKADPSLQVIFLGEEGDSTLAHAQMEKALAEGSIHAAVTFHYPFPVGVATVGHMKAPGNGRDLFISTTTGTMAVDRVEALARNAIAGAAAAKSFGIPEPVVGLLNLDGASSALKILKGLATRGYSLKLGSSVRGEPLLRGNDVLAGSVDVLVCDSLTANAIVKLMAAWSTSGRIETSGSGYGPAVGEGAPTVGIISRATASPVVAEAIALMARMIRGGLARAFSEEMRAAQAAGFSAARGREAATAVPPRRPVDHEIAGVDVLDIEAAVGALMAGGVYCQAGMGCTGPVLLVSGSEAEKARELLERARYL